MNLNLLVISQNIFLVKNFIKIEKYLLNLLISFILIYIIEKLKKHSMI